MAVILSCAHCLIYFHPTLLRHLTQEKDLEQDIMATRAEKQSATNLYHEGIKNVMSPPDKGTFFCSDSQLNRTLPCTPCVEYLMITPTVRCESVQNR